MEFSLKEELFVPFYEPTQTRERGEFILYVRQIIKFCMAANTQFHSFCLTLSRPFDYEDDVNNFVNFAVSQGAKHLDLGFYDRDVEHGRVINIAEGFPLPEQVYQHHENLQTLKLLWCNFDFDRLTSFKNLESLTLGWITITTSQLWDLVVSCPILNSLWVANCVGLEALHISVPDDSRLKYLVVDKCKFDSGLLLLDGPKLTSFVYTGNVARFHMGNTRDLVEVRLDFEEQMEFITGPLLCELLDQLVDVMILNICSVFLQIIPSGVAHYCTDTVLNVQHLTLSNTELHINELIGIKFMLASCPRMITLTLYLLVGKIFPDYKAPYQMTNPNKNFRRETDNTAETCLRESLQVLNVHGFLGISNQMKFIEYVIRYGRCLRSVNLYLPQVNYCGYDDYSMTFVVARAKHLMRTPRANPGLEVTVEIPPYFVNPID